MSALLKGTLSEAARKVLLAVAAWAGVCLAALSAGDAGAADAPNGTARANGVGAPIAWAECDPPGSGVQCATIRVPLDWDRPNGRTIRLALVRHLASKPAERIGTLFINPGGPGDTGVGLVRGDPKGSTKSAAVASTSSAGIAAAPRAAPGCAASRADEARIDSGRAPRSPPRGRKRSAFSAGRRRGEALWRGRRLALAPHLDRGHRPRPPPPAGPDGEAKLTYVGLSYGSYLGETYATRSGSTATPRPRPPGGAGAVGAGAMNVDRVGYSSPQHEGSS